MNGWVLASVSWVTVLLLPPSRIAVEWVARFLWPSKLLGTKIQGTPIPFVLLLFVGYPLSVFIFNTLLRLLDGLGIGKGFASRSSKPDMSEGAGVAITVLWIFAAFLLGRLSIHLAAVGVFVVLGVLARLPWEPPPRPEPRPEPEPVPVPVPPKPLPDSGPPEEWGGDSDENGMFRRNYRWLFNTQPYLRKGREHSFAMKMEIPREIYDAFKSRDHRVMGKGDYVKFINEGLDDEVMADGARKLRAIVEENAFDRLAEIHLAMAFTLSIPYAFDDEEYGGEYPKYPVESLVEKRGDCEDHANLCGALLHRLGHRVALVLLPAHAALAVEAPVPIEGATVYVPELGIDMYYCEVTPSADATTEKTTEVQWWLGMEPEAKAIEGIYVIGN